MKPLEDIDPADFRLFMDPDGDALVADGPALFERIFSHPAAPQLDAAEWYIRRAVSFSNGTHHEDLRRRMTDLLGEQYGTLDSDRPFPFEAGAGAPTTARLNLVEDICVPVANQMITTYVVIPEGMFAYLDAFNAIRFHRDLRIGRIIELDKVVGAIRTATLACPDRARFVDLIPTFLITRHTFLGTIALTIAEQLAKAQDNHLKSIEFSQMLSATALPYLARVAPRDLEGKSRCYSAGQGYRCPVSTHPKSTGPNEIPSFGEPPRRCLGRTMSFIVWRRLADALNRMIQARIDAGQSRFEVETAVEIPEVGDHPIGGDLRFS